MEKKNRSMLFFVILMKSAKLLKALKAAKFLKPVLSLGTMIISAIVYSFNFGPWFAIGLVLMLFIHEMGHVMALKQRGYKTSVPVFIPMLGAVIFAPKMHSRDDEAYVGFAGPLVGGAAALLMFLTLFISTHPVLVLVSLSATFLNLFNMVPVRPLDGGRVTQIIGEWFKYLGLSLVLLFTFMVQDPGLLIIWMLILDDMPLSRKAILRLGIIIWIAMVYMMKVANLGPNMNWAENIDIAVGLLFVGLFKFQNNMSKNLEEMRAEIIRRGLQVPEENDNDEQPLSEIPQSVKNGWLTKYLLLTAALVILLLAHGPYLSGVVPPKQ